MQLASDLLSYALVAVGSVLTGYYLYFFSRLAFFRPKAAASLNEPLSIIVCGRNEQFHLENNIPKWLQQQLKNGFELVVVNDQSEDDTRQILQWLARNEPNLRPIHIERKGNERIGKKYPLSIGIREARHAHLLLTDADCVPASDLWAAKMTSAFTHGIDIVLGYGAYEKHPGLLNKLIRFETFHSALQYLSYALAGVPYMGVGRNLSYKKELFFKHKGFASISHIPGGDDDLFISKAATASNTAVMIDADAHTISVPEQTWKNWRRQKTRHYSTSKYYKPAHQLLLGLYSLGQFLFYPLLFSTLILSHWQAACVVLLIKSMAQYIIFSKAMRKLNESDLIKWIFFMDLWMFVYYLMFAGTLWKKEKKTW
ncbi:glycosyltransferase [Niabella insulamsoli]|uniref:glycosyltransferase n=1 Tax=Niabella insulamsoli TaxID=3144874 RepID=UPI0031FC265A